jgi:hypothetical protein
MNVVFSPAMLKRLCASFSTKVNSQREGHDHIVKIEHFESPRCLTRRETENFFTEHFFCNTSQYDMDDRKIACELAAQSDLILVFRSDLFGVIDDIFLFRCLNKLYKDILEELIIGSRWEGLITSSNELGIAGHVILVKDVEAAISCRSLNALFERVKIKKEVEIIKIQTMASEEGDFEKLVQNYAESRYRKFTNPPSNGVAIKQEEDLFPLFDY